MWPQHLDVCAGTSRNTHQRIAGVIGRHGQCERTRRDRLRTKSMRRYRSIGAAAVVDQHAIEGCGECDGCIDDAGAGGPDSRGAARTSRIGMRDGNAPSRIASAGYFTGCRIGSGSCSNRSRSQIQSRFDRIGIGHNSRKSIEFRLRDKNLRVGNCNLLCVAESHAATRFSRAVTYSTDVAITQIKKGGGVKKR